MGHGSLESNAQVTVMNALKDMHEGAYHVEHKVLESGT